MPHYISTWRTPDNELEESRFFVEADPDPPGKWIVWYRWTYHGEHIDYWIKLPKQSSSQSQFYMRRDEVVKRDLTCDAGSCERLSMERVEVEVPNYTRLALQIEAGYACLEKRQARKFVSLICEDDIAKDEYQGCVDQQGNDSKPGEL